MQKLCLTVTVTVAVLSAGFLMNRANAMTPGTPAAIRAAIEDIAVIDQVHCRPGWPHHAFRPHDGCFRGFIFRRHHHHFHHHHHFRRHHHHHRR